MCNKCKTKISLFFNKWRFKVFNRISLSIESILLLIFYPTSTIKEWYANAKDMIDRVRVKK